MKRRCSRCEQYLDVSNFYKRKTSWLSHCKACISAYNKTRGDRLTEKKEAKCACGETNQDKFSSHKNSATGKQDKCKKCMALYQKNMPNILKQDRLNLIRFRFKRWIETGEFK